MTEPAHRNRIIKGLVELLPEIGSTMTATERAQFGATFESALQVLYPEPVAAPEPTVQEGNR